MVSSSLLVHNAKDESGKIYFDDYNNAINGIKERIDQTECIASCRIFCLRAARNLKKNSNEVTQMYQGDFDKE